VLRYSLRDLVRNPRRTFASAVGVALAVGLFSSTAFFIDGSAARMTERAIAPVAIDMQADLTSPLGSALTLSESVGGGPSLAPGQTAKVTMIVTNTSDRIATAVVVRDLIPSQMAYVAGSTTLNGAASPDGAGDTPLAAGVNAGSLPVGGAATVTYQVRATAAIPTLAGLPLRGTVVSAEDPAPAPANGVPAVSLSQLASRVRAVSGVTAVDQLAAIDLPVASLKSGTKSLAQPLRVFAFDPVFLQHYPMVRQTAGSYSNGTVLLSPDAAQALGASLGSNVALTVPGRTAPLQLSVGGIADFSKADALFAARSADNQGEFIQVPNVLVVPISTFGSILPGLKADAASNNPVLKTSPVLEADIRLDRSRLATDPTVAAVTTQGLKRSIERLAPGRVAVIDNLSDTLVAATSDSILAKVLFLFLGLPGVLVAAYLSRYAGGLLAQARRREQATLRARGAQPRHLVSDLTYTAFGVAVLGSALGLALGVATTLAVLGPSALQTASPQSFLVSAAISVAAGVATTLLAVYLPGRRALAREAANERREMDAVAGPPVWLRMKLDLVLLAAAALVWIITNLAGGFRITPAEGQSVSLSFYTLLAPLLAWLGITLLAVRVLLWGTSRIKVGGGRRMGRLTTGTLLRSVSRRSLALGSGVIALALAVAFGSSLALFIATYDAEKQADARFVIGSDIRVTPSALAQQSSDFASQLQVPGVSGVTPVAQTSSAGPGDNRRRAVSPRGDSQRFLLRKRDRIREHGRFAKRARGLAGLDGDGPDLQYPNWRPDQRPAGRSDGPPGAGYLPRGRCLQGLPWVPAGHRHGRQHRFLPVGDRHQPGFDLPRADV
jgi:uncharacterized repeat protein (TIGR01451 family)